MIEPDRRDDRGLASAVVEEAQRNGADMVEAYLARGEETVVEVRNKEVENLKIAREEGMGIRIIKGKTLGFAYTSDLTWDSIKKAITDALANARAASEDPYNVLPEPSPAYPNLVLEDPVLKNVSIEKKIEIAKRIEESGWSCDRRIQITERTCYEEAHYQVTIANSKGVLVSSSGSHCGGYAIFVAGEDGDQQTGFDLQFTRNFGELDPERIGKGAAYKAVRMLGARRLGTKHVPVVFEPYVVTEFLGMLASALGADAVLKGRSLFAGKAGERVAAPGVTIVDDGTLPGGLASAPFDGEGVPSQRTVLISGGRLQGYLHNAYTGAKEGVLSTGNAVRGSFSTTPELGSTNFYLMPGDVEPSEIIRKTENGLYLTEVMGMHTANPISGDFSVGAAGIWIEGGELTTPVRGMVIAGNILELLGRIDLIGSDLQFFTGKGAPTIRVAGLTVSGE